MQVIIKPKVIPLPVDKMTKNTTIGTNIIIMEQNKIKISPKRDALFLPCATNMSSRVTLFLILISYIRLSFIYYSVIY